MNYLDQLILGFKILITMHPMAMGLKEFLFFFQVLPIVRSTGTGRRHFHRFTTTVFTTPFLLSFFHFHFFHGGRDHIVFFIFAIRCLAAENGVIGVRWQVGMYK